MNTGNIKQLIAVAAIGFLTACGDPVPDAVLLQSGVSRELAQFRKEHFKEVRYNLFFSIPEFREKAVTGKAEAADYHRLHGRTRTGCLGFVEW